MNVRALRNARGEVTSYKVTVKWRGTGPWYFTRLTKLAAERCWVNAIEDLEAGHDPYDRYRVERARGGETVRSWSKTWLAAQDYEPNWRAKVDGFLERDILPRFGDALLSDGLSRIEAKSWLTSLSTKPRKRTGKPLKPATIAHIWGTFSQLCADAVAEGLLERDPCAGLEPPKVAKTSDRRHYIEPAQVLALAEEMVRPFGRRTEPTARQETFRVLTIELYGTGCRFSELAGLRRNPKEVLLMRRPPAIRVVEPIKTTGQRGGRYHSDPKSEAGKRTIELITPHAELLATLIAHGKVYAFSSAVDTAVHYEEYRKAFKAAAKALGHPEWTVHDLRHSHATLLRDCPRRAVQERLGHQPQDTTDVYTHALDEDRAAILRIIAAAWKGANAAPRAARGSRG